MSASIDTRNPSSWPAALTPEQVAQILNISRNHVYAQCEMYRREKRHGTSNPQGIPNLKIGKSVRIPRAAILLFLRESMSPDMPAI